MGVAKITPMPCLNFFSRYLSRHLLLFIFFSFLFHSNRILANSRASAKDSDSLVLAIGQRILLPIKADDHIWLSNGHIAKIKDLHSQIQLTAYKIGTAFIKISNQSKTLFVISKKNYKTYKKLLHLTDSMKGLRIDVDENHQISLRGKLLRLKDWLIIAQGMDSTSNFKFKANISEYLREEIHQHFNQLFSKNNLQPLNLQFFPHLHFQMPQSLKKIKNSYTYISSPYGINIKLSPYILASAPMVRVQITVAEMKRSEVQSLGVQWNSFYKTNILSPSYSSQDLIASLHALERNGKNRILATPTLVCQSGKSASFLAGGEIPIQIINKGKQHVVWKKYGVLLKISPKADLRGQMSIGIETEVSSLDMGHSANGLPALNTNRIKSHFNLSESQTIVLSGLVQQNQGKAAEGFPFISRLPIIGRLFSSRNFLMDKTELVIFVTPKMISTRKKRHGLREEIKNIKYINPIIKKFLSEK